MNVGSSQTNEVTGNQWTADAAEPPEQRLEMQEWLTFKLGAEEYGIDILHVQEIRSYEQPTRMVHMPATIKGVVNLRGSIVPIVDLRIGFNLADVHYSELTVVIVVNVCNRAIGLVVDSVSEVTRFTQDQIQSTRTLGQQSKVDFVQSIGSVANRTLLLLDTHKLVDSPEMGLSASRLQ